MKKLIKKILRESDFDWVNDIITQPSKEEELVTNQTYYVYSPNIDGYWIKYTYGGFKPNIGYDKKGRHLWTQDNGGTMYYDSEYTKKLLDSGYILTFKPDDGKPTINESDFDWVEDIEPMIPEEKFIIDLIDSSDKIEYENGLSYKKGGEFYFYQDITNKVFWFDYENVSSVLESKFGLSIREQRALIKSVVERHYGIWGYTTEWVFDNEGYI